MRQNRETLTMAEKRALRRESQMRRNRELFKYRHPGTSSALVHWHGRFQRHLQQIGAAQTKSTN